ncbi:hypothetical protein EYF80_046091 [Liparis tanakae]|uniref:Uncharacterized protein n=1 Tax=Liparis tanakae TaxID=230148 RepID=A0A4Z2FR31_9TELE|nr:hypothetical protein EYF80_046091 [Liparis tanakae]
MAADLFDQWNGNYCKVRVQLNTFTLTGTRSRQEDSGPHGGEDEVERDGRRENTDRKRRGSVSGWDQWTLPHFLRPYFQFGPH